MSGVDVVPTFSLGLDFGTGSVRALLVDTATGEEVGVGVAPYARGSGGVIGDPRQPDLARQHPADHLAALQLAVAAARQEAQQHPGFRTERIVGIGVDTTGSTPLPVDDRLVPLAMHDDLGDEPDALAWLWKDHTAHDEAAAITAAAARQRLPYLRKCGGTYSAEWYWAKILRCERSNPRVAGRVAAWLELCDFVPAWLAGLSSPLAVQRSICAAAHKAMYHPDWQGLPSAAFLASLSPGLARHRATFAMPARAGDHRAGTLAPERASRLGLPPGIPIAVGALDAHCGAVGSGIAPGTLVKILGTSTCDCLVAPLEQPLPDVAGVSGIAPESILPGMHGIEAGQSAVGDIFQWFVQHLAPGSDRGDRAHADLAAAAQRLRPGASGLLALDWHNGNRCVLADPRLSGLVLGLSLATTPAELYRALIEATAFGARVILDRLAEHGVRVERIVSCGGLAGKSPLLMQIYADVLGVPLLSARSAEACALGAAVFGAVVGGAHRDVTAAQRAMTGVKPQVYAPEAAAHVVYTQLYALYRELHDAFGSPGARDLSHVMKRLLELRDRALAARGPS